MVMTSQNFDDYKVKKSEILTKIRINMIGLNWIGK